MKVLQWIFLGVILGLVFGCREKASSSQQEKQSITIFAAASLTGVLTQLIDSFEKAQPVAVKVNYASSGTLARQISQGANPDIYLSADRQWMDFIQGEGLLIQNQAIEIAYNQLVLITSKQSGLSTFSIDSSSNLEQLLTSDGRLGMGNPNHVPAGKYAKQALEYFGWYEAIKSNILPTKDVRMALATVELEEAPIGIVYQTDAFNSQKVKILGTFPASSHSPIVYLAGLCQDSPTGKTFLGFLQSKKAQEIWKMHGFR